MGKRYTSRDVTCPFCGAGAGESCRGSVRAGRGYRAVGNHNSRIQAARALNEARGDTFLNEPDCDSRDCQFVHVHGPGTRPSA